MTGGSATVDLDCQTDGTTWQAEETVDFDFGEDDKTDDDNFPAAGGTYQNCYVLASTTAADGLSAELTLLSPTELTGFYDTTPETMQSNIETALSTVTSGGISGYRAFKPTDATFSAEKNNVRASTVLRPVATITLTKD